jgi:hypothetical protein
VNKQQKPEGYFSGNLPSECYSTPRGIAGELGCLSIILLPALLCLGVNVMALAAGAGYWWSWLCIVFSGWLIYILSRSVYQDNLPLTNLSLAYSPYKKGDYENRGAFPGLLRYALWLDELALKHGVKGLREFGFQYHGQSRPIKHWHPANEVKETTELLIRIVMLESTCERKDILLEELGNLSALLDRAQGNRQTVAFYLA